MTDLERVLDLIEDSTAWSAVKTIIDAHEKEDAARERKLQDWAEFFYEPQSLREDLEAELAVMRKREGQPQ